MDGLPLPSTERRSCMFYSYYLTSYSTLHFLKCTFSASCQNKFSTKKLQLAESDEKHSLLVLQISTYI